MKKKSRNPYSDSFKADAGQLYKACGSFSKVCQDLDISDGALRDWVAKHDAKLQQASTSSPLSSSERDELERLRKDNKRLLMERDILKKAAAFFAKENS